MLELRYLRNLPTAGQPRGCWRLNLRQMRNLVNHRGTRNLLMWDRCQRWKLAVYDLMLELGLKMSELRNLFSPLVTVSGELGNLSRLLGNLFRPRLTEIGDLRCWCNVHLDSSCRLGKLKVVLNMFNLPRDWWEGARRGRMLNQTLMLRLTR